MYIQNSALWEIVTSFAMQVMRNSKDIVAVDEIVDFIPRDFIVMLLQCETELWYAISQVDRWIVLYDLYHSPGSLPVLHAVGIRLNIAKKSYNHMWHNPWKGTKS